MTAVDISGTIFPKVNGTEGFWYVKDEFIKHSHRLLNQGQLFSSYGARLEGRRWVIDGNPISINETASFVWSLRLFYMKNECMSIFSICNYLEDVVDNVQTKKFFRHMRDNWEKHLGRDAMLDGDDYPGPIKTNKQLIDTLLYSGNFYSFHSQEKYKKRYDQLLEYMDESLIFISAYRALHSGYQMMQISQSLSDLREDNMVIMLPNHLQHEWDDNCPYNVIR